MLDNEIIKERDVIYEELNDILYYNLIDKAKRAKAKEGTLRIDADEIISHSFLDSIITLFKDTYNYKRNVIYNKVFSKKDLIDCIFTAFKHCSYINEKSVAVNVALMIDEEGWYTDEYWDTEEDLETDVVVKLDKHQETVWKSFDNDLVNLLGFKDIDDSLERFGNMDFDKFDKMINKSGRIANFIPDKTIWNIYLRDLYLRNDDIFKVWGGIAIPNIMLRIRENIIRKNLGVIKKIDYLEFTINIEKLLAYKPKMTLKEAINSVFEKRYEDFLESIKEKLETDKCFGEINLDDYVKLKEGCRPLMEQYYFIEFFCPKNSNGYKIIDNLESNCNTVLKELEAKIKGVDK